MSWPLGQRTSWLCSQISSHSTCARAGGRGTVVSVLACERACERRECVRLRSASCRLTHDAPGQQVRTGPRNRIAAPGGIQNARCGVRASPRTRVRGTHQPECSQRVAQDVVHLEAEVPASERACGRAGSAGYTHATPRVSAASERSAPLTSAVVGLAAARATGTGGTAVRCRPCAQGPSVRRWRAVDAYRSSASEIVSCS